MRLKYKDMEGEHEVEAVVTTAHASSSYGIPAIVLADGTVVSTMAWYFFQFEVVEATEEEYYLLQQAI